MNKTKGKDKCLTMLLTKHFLSVKTDPTKTLEIKMRRVLSKNKPKSSEQEYKRLYPTGSRAVKFYRTGKIHNFPLNGNIDDVQFRSQFISNISTATYNLAKLLSKLLAPLRESEHTVDY